MSKKILFITTSHAALGDTGRLTGVWAEELAVPYAVFTDAGCVVDIASPQGGAVPLDPGSVQKAGENPAPVERFLSDPVAQQKTQSALAIAQVDIAAYDAIYLPGGHGAMWDLPNDAAVTRAIERVFAAGKVVSAVCHGVAGLLTARAPNGQPLVAGRRVNGFTNDEEAAAGLTEVVPFLVETRLKDLGGLFEKAPNWESFAVQDGLLITGQNPASSARVAELVIRQLGLV